MIRSNIYEVNTLDTHGRTALSIALWTHADYIIVHGLVCGGATVFVETLCRATAYSNYNIISRLLNGIGAAEAVNGVGPTSG